MNEVGLSVTLSYKKKKKKHFSMDEISQKLNYPVSQYLM